MFSGTYTAIVTPFRDGQVDERALRGLVEFQIENGVEGIVPSGSTGEAATLDDDEQLRAIRIVVEQAKGRGGIVPGTVKNSTRGGFELSRKAAKAGGDGFLLASPYYNKPTQ